MDQHDGLNAHREKGRSRITKQGEKANGLSPDNAEKPDF
jgi:hypothetical protein